MDTIAVDPTTARIDAACGHRSATEVRSLQGAGAEILNVETVVSNSLLPSDAKFAIRFRADGTLMIVLGMRDLWRGRLSAYFADLVTARLGIPFRQVRIYYSAMLPAVLRTPVPSADVIDRNHIDPIACAVADIIEEMCGQLVEKGRSAFAAIAGVGTPDIGFDQSTGRFFLLSRKRSNNIYEIAKSLRGGSPLPSGVAGKPRRSVQRLITEEIKGKLTALFRRTRRVSEDLSRLSMRTP